MAGEIAPVEIACCPGILAFQGGIIGRPRDAHALPGLAAARQSQYPRSPGSEAATRGKAGGRWRGAYVVQHRTSSVSILRKVEACAGSYWP